MKFFVTASGAGSFEGAVGTWAPLFRVPEKLKPIYSYQSVIIRSYLFEFESITEHLSVHAHIPVYSKDFSIN